VASPALENVPGAQIVQTDAPLVEYVPATQCVHAVTKLAPTNEENVPGLHSTQSSSAPFPVTVENFPALHWTHVFALSAPASVEYVPAAHLLHAASPDAILYLPASHCVQFPPLTPEKPALHAQAVEVVLCKGELECDGQL